MLRGNLWLSLSPLLLYLKAQVVAEYNWKITCYNVIHNNLHKLQLHKRAQTQVVHTQKLHKIVFTF